MQLSVVDFNANNKLFTVILNNGSNEETEYWPLSKFPPQAQLELVNQMEAVDKNFLSDLGITKEEIMANISEMSKADNSKSKKSKLKELFVEKILEQRRKVMAEFQPSTYLSENYQVNVDEVVEYFGKHMIHSKDLATILAYAWNSGNNVMLTGPGGYGKSTAFKLFSKFLIDKGIIRSYYINSFNEATNVDKLFEGINFKVLNETGFQHFNAEQSFLNYRIACFDEFLDARIQALSALKDTLAAKALRNGSQVEPMFTRMIVGLTNQKWEDVVVNDSTKALVERFPLSYTVVWPSHTLEDYKAQLELLCDRNPQYSRDYIEFIATLMVEVINSTKRSAMPIIPSARMCEKAFELVQTTPLDSVRFMEGYAKPYETVILKFSKLVNEQLKNLKNKTIKKASKNDYTEVQEVFTEGSAELALVPLQLENLLNNTELTEWLNTNYFRLVKFFDGLYQYQKENGLAIDLELSEDELRDFVQKTQDLNLDANIMMITYGSLRIVPQFQGNTDIPGMVEDEFIKYSVLADPFIWLNENHGKDYEKVVPLTNEEFIWFVEGLKSLEAL